MGDNGKSFFTANKKNRQTVFSFTNQDKIDPVAGGDQSAMLHPEPAVLDNSQKVGNPIFEPAPTYASQGPPGQGTGRQPGSSINDAINNK